MVPHPHGARRWAEASQRAFHTVPKSAKHAPGPELEPEQLGVVEWTQSGDKKHVETSQKRGGKSFQPHVKFLDQSSGD